MTDVMPMTGWGVATRKDYLLVDFDKDELITKFRNIRQMSAEAAAKEYAIQKAPHWSFPHAHSLIPADISRSVRTILFRPFDVRFVFYEKYMIERGDHRYDLMRHMHEPNLSLITVRRSEIAGSVEHFYCADTMSVLHSTSSKEGNFVSPLYLYPDPASPTLFDATDWPPGPQGRTPNLNPDFVRDFAGRLGLTFVSDGRGDLETTFGPEDIFHYAYAVFHSPEYRARYGEFLKIDFPRLPLTSDRDLFRALAGLGARLVDLHLLRVPVDLITGFPVGGDNAVAAGYPKYDEGQRRVYLNKTQYVSDVEPEVWAFQVGGYQVLEKWLKDRRGRTLTFDDVMHYQRVVAALSETMQIMEQIDEAIGGFPLP